MSCRWKKRDSELRLVRMRCRRSSAAVSSKVRSGCSVITATTRSACCSSGETLPPRGFGAALLLSLQRCIHLTTELTLTPKCSAASCRDAPASTISIARSRKSQEYDFGIVTPRVRESMLKQSPIHDRLGIPRFKSAGSRFSSAFRSHDRTQPGNRQHLVVELSKSCAIICRQAIDLRGRKL